MEVLRNRHVLAGVGAVAVAVVTSACASSGTPKPRPFPLPSGSATTAPATPTPGAAAQPPSPTPPGGVTPSEPTLVETALSFRGTPYRNGGSDPSGFDCSGFTQWVFARYGVSLPREVHDQFEVGRKIKLDDLQPGDLVFFHTVARGASHVGIVVAGDEFVHAPSSRGVVRVEHLSSSYWSRRFVGGRRIQADLAVARRRPSGGESTVAAAAASRSGAPGSRASD